MKKSASLNAPRRIAVPCFDAVSIPAGPVLLITAVFYFRKTEKSFADII